MTPLRTLVRLALALPALAAAADREATGPDLRLEAKIALGDVNGRIDHLAFDAGRRRLFVAERGNDSVSVVDVAGHKVLRRLSVPEPQGVAFARSSDALFVTSGADGSVARFSGDDLRRDWRSELGSDADNLRVDPAGARIVVGYGNGALAVLDAATGAMLQGVALPVHPESFQLEASGPRAFVNLAEAGEVAVADRATGRLNARWPLPVRANFPMALDESAGRLWIVSREPPALLMLDTRGGGLLGRKSTCADADDVFLDSQRARAYVICGEGAIDVFEQRAGALVPRERIASTKGARTALFVPELDRLLLAVRASGAAPAAIWIYRPEP
jgi:YVTN family beta-propeller protein